MSVSRIGITCKDCTRRHVGCHSECAEYIEAKTAWEKEKAVIDKERYKGIDKISYLYDTYAKYNRGHRPLHGK